MKNKLVFVGNFYPDLIKEKLLAIQAPLDMAAHTFQTALLVGLDNWVDVKVLTSPPLRVGYREIKRIESFSFSHNCSKDKMDVYVGVNNSCVRMLGEAIRIYKHLKSILKKDPECCVCIYSLRSPFLLPIFILRRKIKKSCVVVPDLPEYMSSNTHLLRKLAKWIDRKIINKCLDKIDSFVLFSELMKERLPIGNKPWRLMEGIYNTSVKIINYPKEHNKTILYTGSISVRYGVMDLVEAFTQIEYSDYRLWLCGSVDNMTMLEDYIKKDNRIIYYGIVDKDKVFELQQKATVLVNPRHSNEEFTKYSFPSKTMEYMASGTPTLMCKLFALPADYLPHLFIFEDESIEGYRKKLVEICQLNKQILDEKGKAASVFIRTKKNETVQAKIVVDMMFL